jgi:hypothetical protein
MSSLREVPFFLRTKESAQRCRPCVKPGHKNKTLELVQRVLLVHLCQCFDALSAKGALYKLTLFDHFGLL